MYNREDRIIGVCRGTYIFLRYMVISCAASAREGPVILELVNNKMKKSRVGISKMIRRINVSLNDVQ